MEDCSPAKSDSTTELRPLSPVRLFRGVMCLVVFLSTAFMFLVFFSPVAFSIRLFSVHFSRKTASFLFGLWLALWPFLFEVINGTKVVFYGDVVPRKERVLLMANHRTEVDWMYLWNIALRRGCLGYIKYILKSSLMNLPLFGWGFHILEFIPVERKWEIDEPVLYKILSSFSNRRDPLWLAVFPEGTDYTEEKCKRSRGFAIKNDLPVLENVLLPKTRGFCACLGALRASLDSDTRFLFSNFGIIVWPCNLGTPVYDVTIAYKHQCPSFLDNVFGVGPSEVHLHVRCIPIAEIPASDDEASAWLMEKFKVKDELLSYFKAQGHFPEAGGEDKLSALKCSLNFVGVICLTALFTYLTFFSSYWFKIYVGLSCVHLSLSTYFDIRPRPVLGFLNSVVGCTKQSRD